MPINLYEEICLCRSITFHPFFITGLIFVAVNKHTSIQLIVVMKTRHKIIPFTLFVALVVMLGGVAPLGTLAESTPVNVWWPTSGAHVTGMQPFKAQVSGLDVSQYEMFWQVDNGQWNPMNDNSTDYPHKEASVNVSSWNWHGAGPYTVNFIARQNGNVIAQQQEQVYIDNGQPVLLTAQPQQQVVATSGQNPLNNSIALQPTPTVAPAATTDPDPVHAQLALVKVFSSKTNNVTSNTTPAPQPVVASVNVSASTNNSSSLYVDPNSDAAKQEAGMSGAAADEMKLLASEPTASWFGNWNSDIWSAVHGTVAAAAAQNQTPVLVAYNIPARDCGGYSSGGSNRPSGYQSWIGAFANAIGSNKAVVILEPDALAEIGCLSSADQATRLSLLSGAVSALKANANTKVYIDAGHANWIDASTMASNLQKANVTQADGFSLDVSNFDATTNEISYGQQISSQTGGKHFVVDTSRNGNGSNGQWCNPSGMAIGQKPTLSTGNSIVDAFLWIKTPGESDGNCNGGPSAGQWWPDYALQLVQNAH